MYPQFVTTGKKEKDKSFISLCRKICSCSFSKLGKFSSISVVMRTTSTPFVQIFPKKRGRTKAKPETEYFQSCPNTKHGKKYFKFSMLDPSLHIDVVPVEQRRHKSPIPPVLCRREVTLLGKLFRKSYWGHLTPSELFGVVTGAVAYTTVQFLC